MPRILLKVEYLGTNYHGWQRQASLCSVQETIEKALQEFLQEQVVVFAAGRTDRGVHALGQVLHFDTTKTRDIKSYVFGVNHFLPSDIQVLTAEEVAPDFHARFNAVYRQYQIRIFNRRIDSAVLQHRVLWHPIPLDVVLMQEGANYLLGENDFSSFRGADCQAHSSVKYLHFCKLRREDDFIFMDIRAGGFLHNMVRNITGVLIKIGEGKQPPIWAKDVLEAKAREAGGKTVGPDGLYFTEVGYPTSVGLSSF